MKSTMEFEGLDEYLAALEKAGQDVNLVSRDALAELGPMIQAEMIRKCPTQKLAPYINIFTPSREGDYNYVAVGYIRDIKYTPREAAILANVVEFGSVHNGPMPHIRPVVRAFRSRVNKHIAARLQAAGLVDR